AWLALRRRRAPHPRAHPAPVGARGEDRRGAVAGATGAGGHAPARLRRHAERAVGLGPTLAARAPREARARRRGTPGRRSLARGRALKRGAHMPFLFAVFSSMLYGVADFLGGMSARRGPVIAVTAWFQVTGLACLVVYALFAPGVTRPGDLAWAAGSGAAGGLGVTLLYRALASGTVSTAAPLISMIALSVPVAVGLALGERPGVLPLSGIALGVVAVALISAK